MDIRHLQMLLAAANYYRGAVDGDAGPQTLRGVEIVERNGGAPDASAWPIERRFVAAAQRILNAMGHEAGAVDGWLGHNTREALTTWLSLQSGVSPHVPREPEPGYTAPQAAEAFPTQAQMPTFYGPPGNAQATAGRVRLPFGFKLSWQPSVFIDSFAAHPKAAPIFQLVFEAAAKHYGEKAFRELELDVFGGGYNNRAMRGGTKPSTHAFGAAFDLNPVKNALRMGTDRAQFAQPAYDAWWKIVGAHGLVSLGQAIGRDWMHVQAARLR